MIETLCLAAMSLAAVAALAVRSLHFVHMLQLNSYRNERYGAWLKQNRKKYFAVWLIWASMSLISSSVIHYLSEERDPLMESFFAGFTAVLLVVLAILSRPKKAKKPLVYTARVKRLLVTLWGLFLLILGAVFVWLHNLFLSMVAVVVLTVLLPLLVPFANLINAPMEKAIQNGYINDAKRRIEEMPALTVIGITGSYGKTSTKTCLHALLSARYNVLMTPESYNTTMGVVRTIREQLRPTHQIFIAEMGAKNVGDIKEICDLVHPQYGIITSIGEQHLETFGSVENVAATKFELADALPQDGTAFLNADNPYIRERLDTVNAGVVTYGTEQGDYRASEFSFDRQGCRFTVTAPDGSSAVFTTKLLGGHNIQNLTGCIAVAHTLGIPLSELVYPVRMLRPVPHRLQLLPNGYIDDAYNSNPAGFRSALLTLKAFEGERVLVTPGMVELGARQEALNRELGAFAAYCCDYAVLVGRKQAPPLKEGLLSAGFPKENIFVAANLQEGLAHLNARPALAPRTVLLENDLPDNF